MEKESKRNIIITSNTQCIKSYVTVRCCVLVNSLYKYAD